MSRSEFDRRKFNRLAAAALGGMASGAMIGCGRSAPAPGGGATPAAGGGETTETAMADVHVCRGLNACKGKGAGGENECAGQGACATAEHHHCHFQNACKGQGGCGETAGMNECKGKGECAVPLMEKTWTEARARFEEKMQSAGKEVGAAPEPAA